MDFEKNLEAKDIVLPNAPDPVGAYAATKVVGKLLFISGQISIDKNNQLIKGTLGKNLTTEQGYEAAKRCALNIVSQAKKKCNNDLNGIKSCVKITGYVNSIDSFHDQPKIINSVSELLENVFGINGKHSRAAVSVNSLPLGASVEVDAIFEIK